MHCISNAGMFVLRTCLHVVVCVLHSTSKYFLVMFMFLQSAKFQSCACSQLETYATSCINRGIDLSNWAADVEFCPMDCPAGMTYKPNGASPPATCGKPAGTDTVRGCFCPDDKVFQDGKCIDSSECKCLYEGIIYNNGDTIKKEVECQVCTCQDGGSMTCEEMQCPALECEWHL